MLCQAIDRQYDPGGHTAQDEHNEQPFEPGFAPPAPGPVMRIVKLAQAAGTQLVPIHHSLDSWKYAMIKILAASLVGIKLT